MTLKDGGNLNCVCLVFCAILIVKGVREGLHCGGLVGLVGGVGWWGWLVGCFNFLRNPRNRGGRDNVS